MSTASSFVKLLTDLAFLAYALGVMAVFTRLYFWDDIKAWWANYQARRAETEQLNKLWEQGGFD